MQVLTKVLGSKNQRELKRLGKIVLDVNAFEADMQALNDDDLKAKTQEFRDRIIKGETLDQLLPEAFAAIREGSQRVMGMRHFDMQLVGGMTLHNGKIAEMRTGEGKTLVATLAVYLNALSGKGVHVITVNDYLAERDANWMRPLYEFMGLSVGIVISGLEPAQKKAAYAADISYGTNNEFGFDYLRDNMALSVDERVQRGVSFAVIDEVDSILIDEARTPLIISGAAQDSSAMYKQINKLVPKLVEHKELEEGVVEQEGHFVIDLKSRTVELNEAGHEIVEDMLIEAKLLEEGDSLYAPSNLLMLHFVHAALRAHSLYSRNVDYIVQNGQVVIVDEHTGRTMVGRRWGEGLHQAIEAKEGVNIQNESQTLASTTFQNYFRLYGKLSGMTGTADTEAFEFNEIYGLDVVVIPNPLDAIYTHETVSERLEFYEAAFKKRGGRYQLLVVGVVDSTRDNKGYNTLVKSISTLSDMRQDFDLIEVAGTATGYSSGRSECIKSLTSTELAKIYSSADLCLVPSRYETFSQVTLESISVGTPVVAFDLSGPVDIIEQDKTGSLVESFNENKFSKAVEEYLTFKAENLGVIKNDIGNLRDRFSPLLIASEYQRLYKC